MNALMNFAFRDQQMRVIMMEDDPWWVAADLCAILEIANVTMALKKLPADMTALNPIEGGQGRTNRNPVNCVSEPGMWMLVFRSDKPQAEELRLWLSREVLPALRRTGRYEMPGFEPPPVQAFDFDPARLNAGVNVVNAAVKLFGIGYARNVWMQMGLPLAVVDGDASDGDPFAGPLAVFVESRAEVTVQDAAEAIGIADPDFSTRQRIGRLLSRWGWAPHVRKIRRRAVRVYSRPGVMVMDAEAAL